MKRALKIASFLIYYLFFMPNFSLHAGEESGASFKPSLKLSGYSQVGYLNQAQGIDEFKIRRARLSLGGEILEKINYKIQVETIQNPSLLDVEVSVMFLKEVILRFGQFKVPFSRESLTSGSDLETINRSQVVENLCPGRDSRNKGRDIGMALTGHFSRLEYSLGIFNGNGINKADDNSSKDIAGRVVFSPFESFSLGIAHYQGKYGPSSRGNQFDKKRTGMELFFSRDKFSLKGEFILAEDGEIQKKGWYLEGGFYFLPEKFQAIFKYDSLDLNKDIEGDRKDVITLGLNWFLAKKTKLQVNYEYHNKNASSLSNNVFIVQFQAGF